MSFKSGFVTVVGRPNVGKSTLINSIAGEKLAITSPKPQTTRNRLMAIVTEKSYQIVFVDTPGIHRPKNRLGEYMVKTAADSMSGADIILYLYDASFKSVSPADREIIKQVSEAKAGRKMLVLTKIDMVKKEEVLGLIAAVTKLAEFDEVIPVSALKNDGVNIVVDSIVKALPEGPMYFPGDISTDSSIREIAAELIREKILYFTDDEVPHGVGVEIMSFKEPRREDLACSVEATVYCEKDSHKGILIGKDGAMLKKIGTAARKDIERLMGRRVNLKLRVKVKEDWRNSPGMLRELGFKDEK